MRSLLAAASLMLAIGAVPPAFAQALTPEESAAKGEAGNTEIGKSEIGKTEIGKTDPKSAAKGEARAARGGKAARSGAKTDPKGETKPPVIPPSVGSNQVPAPGGRNVTATGKTMPPASGRAGATPVKSSTEADMLKAQKAAEDRNKAWDAKMRRTMSTICNGC